MELKIRDMAQMIEHTNLKAFSTKEDFKMLCDEAKEYGFKSVVVNGEPAAFCSGQLKGSDVLLGVTIGFPLGQMTIEAKVFEAEDAIKNGCDEFDYVLNVGKVKEHDYGYIEKEMKALAEAARKNGKVCKVIYETCYLTDEEIIEVSRIAARVRPDFVKTSTGFGTGGAKPEHVRLMKENAGGVAVIASGGIRSFETAKMMIEAGAVRLGTSSGVEIIKEMKEAEGL